MNKFFVFFVLIYLPFASKSQWIMSADSLRTNFNNYVLKIKSGRFNISTKYQMPENKANFQHHGEVIFLKDHLAVDSISRFIVYVDDKMTEIYDGFFFYTIDYTSKIVKIKEINRSLKDIFRRSNSRLLAFFPFLQNRETTSSKLKFNNRDSILYFQHENSDFWRIIHEDSIKNPYKINLEDPKMIPEVVNYVFSASDFHLVELKKLFGFGKNQEIRTYNFSEISPLAPSTTFEDFFNLDDFKNNGFVIEDEIAQPEFKKCAIKTGDSMPNFTFYDQNGIAFGINDWKEKKLLIVDFWFQQCFGCQLSFPYLEDFHQKYEQLGVAVLGVNAVNTSLEIQKFLSNKKISFKSYSDLNRRFVSENSLNIYPTIILIDIKTQKVIELFSGFSDEKFAQMEQIILDFINK